LNIKRQSSARGEPKGLALLIRPRKVSTTSTSLGLHIDLRSLPINSAPATSKVTFASSTGSPDGFHIRVITLPVLVLLKMVAYLDNSYSRAKDIGDIAHILRDYEIDSDTRFNNISTGFGNQIAQLAAKRQPDLSSVPAM
jgi:hypothetical protein